MADEPAADELADRRGKREKPPRKSVSEMYPVTNSEETPQLNAWLAAQIHHSDTACAAAARAARERWDLNFTIAAKIERTWAAEDSEHLLALRRLLDEYREVYQLDERSLRSFILQTSAHATLMPVGIEYCTKCNKREAIPGTGLCARDGGQWLTDEDRINISGQVSDRLLELQMNAVRTLQDLMDNAGSEMVRMQSAIAILDRSGKGAELNVRHSIDRAAEEQASKLLEERLTKLIGSDFTSVERSALDATDSGIVDAEVVG